MDLLDCRGRDDEDCSDALVEMFEEALKEIAALEPDQQKHFVMRLERVRHESRGWGVGYDMQSLMGMHGFAKKGQESGGAR